jgi:hypothetical protein
MYDQLNLRNDRGNTYTFLFIHGIRGDGNGNHIDESQIVAIYQSSDNEMFDVSVLNDEQYETLWADLVDRRGYFTPGSDTQSQAVVTLETEIDGNDPGWRVLPMGDDDPNCDKDDPPVYVDEGPEDPRK